MREISFCSHQRTNSLIALYSAYDYLSTIKEICANKMGPWRVLFEIKFLHPTFTSNPIISMAFEGTTISYYAIIR